MDLPRTLCYTESASSKSPRLLGFAGEPPVVRNSSWGTLHKFINGTLWFHKDRLNTNEWRLQITINALKYRKHLLRGTQRFPFLICIKMFIRRLQASNPEILLQANIQSPTRTKISINQMFVRLFSHRFVYRDLIKTYLHWLRYLWTQS